MKMTKEQAADIAKRVIDYSNKYGIPLKPSKNTQKNRRKNKKTIRPKGRWSSLFISLIFISLPNKLFLNK